jgi:hypothetical protein
MDLIVKSYGQRSILSKVHKCRAIKKPTTKDKMQLNYELGDMNSMVC